MSEGGNAGSSECAYGLEIRPPFSRQVLEGVKTIETRRYLLPTSLVGTDIWLLEPDCDSKEGVSVFGEQCNRAIKSIGRVRFSSCREYHSWEAWHLHRHEHQVPADSVYEWSGPEKDGPMFAWIVDPASLDVGDRAFPGGCKRLLRSIYILST